MPRRLILTRHAKSAWDDPDQSDVDRPLNDRGRRSAAAIGRWMAERNITPDVALLSTARRVAETWALVSADLAAPVREIWRDSLYLADRETLGAELSLMDAETVQMIAHNPGMAAFAASLAPLPDRDEAHRFVTGATLVIDFDTGGWTDLPMGRVAHFVAPRDLTG